MPPSSFTLQLIACGTAARGAAASRQLAMQRVATTVVNRDASRPPSGYGCRICSSRFRFSLLDQCINANMTVTYYTLYVHFLLVKIFGPKLVFASTYGNIMSLNDENQESRGNHLRNLQEI